MCCFNLYLSLKLFYIYFLILDKGTQHKSYKVDIVPRQSGIFPDYLINLRKIIGFMRFLSQVRYYYYYIYLQLFKETNSFLSTLLLDYSCLDNLEKTFLPTHITEFTSIIPSLQKIYTNHLPSIIKLWSSIWNKNYRLSKHLKMQSCSPPPSKVSLCWWSLDCQLRISLFCIGEVSCGEGIPDHLLYI